RIGACLDEASIALASETGRPWALSRDHHYQMSNRFAWAWKLTELAVPVVQGARIDAHAHRREGGRRGPRRTAADPLRGHHDVVPVALFGLGSRGAPVVLEEDRIDAKRAVRPQKVEARALGVERAVDPVLKNAVGLTGVIQPHVRLDAVPLADRSLAKNWGRARGIPQPREVVEIIVSGSQEIAVRVRPTHRIEPERVTKTGRDDVTDGGSRP